LRSKHGERSQKRVHFEAKIRQRGTAAMPDSKFRIQNASSKKGVPEKQDRHLAGTGVI
jgi:hypothetical protein